MGMLMSSGLRTILPPDEAGAIFCHSLERDFGNAFAGYAAYVRNPQKRDTAFVMHARNAMVATHTHNRFTANALSGREVVLPSTTLPSAFENPGVVMRAQSRLVGGHLCFNLNPRENSPLVLQTVFNNAAPSMPDVATVALRMQAPELIEAMEAAARDFPASDAARLAKTPATPTHYLLHYDMTGSSRIRAVSGNVMYDISTAMAENAARLAEDYRGHLFRFEGDGAWIAVPLPLKDAVHAAKEVKESRVRPLAEALSAAFDAARIRYMDVPDVAASRLKICAMPTYLRAVEINGTVRDYDGDAFEKIRTLIKQPQRGIARKPVPYIADAPSLFAP